jgi:hypothetical protein
MSPVERQIGLHVSRREPPDILVVTTVGDLGEEDVVAILAELHEIGKGGAAIFILADVSRLGRISPAARTAASAGESVAVTGAIAFLGAGFQQRVAVTLVTRAVALLRKEPLVPTAFFQTEAEARVWIEGKRRPA